MAKARVEALSERTGLGDGCGRQAGAGIPVAGPQQVRDDRVRAVLDEVADPVAAIREAAVRAVDLAEGRLAGDDALETGGVGAVVARRVCGGAAGGPAELNSTA